MLGIFLIETSSLAPFLGVIAVAAVLVSVAVYFKQKKLLEDKEREVFELKTDLEERGKLIESGENKIENLNEVNRQLETSLNELKLQYRTLTNEKGLADQLLDEKSKELKRTRLERLNYELSPHAFKNTLNTIKGMAFRMNAATESFTDLLNYMLYETKKNEVTLKEELEFLDQYISLNELMFPPWVKIEKNFQVEEELMGQLSIAPLITVYFAENAFKHAKNDDKNCFIKFSISVEDNNRLRYTVTNKRFIGVASNEKSGVGSENLNERLDLLYPERHRLEMRPIDDLFVASLNLTLDHYDNQVPVG